MAKREGPGKSERNDREREPKSRWLGSRRRRGSQKERSRNHEVSLSFAPFADCCPKHKKRETVRSFFFCNNRSLAKKGDCRAQARQSCSYSHVPLHIPSTSHDIHIPQRVSSQKQGKVFRSHNPHLFPSSLSSFAPRKWFDDVPSSSSGSFIDRNFLEGAIGSGSATRVSEHSVTDSAPSQSSGSRCNQNDFLSSSLHLAEDG